jgi:hypothetical protein
VALKDDVGKALPAL